MSVHTQYKALLKKVASRSDLQGIETSYTFCKTSGAADKLLWASAGALPAYLVGSNIGKDEERSKHTNYALGGAALGFLAPKLLGALINPSGVADSVAGIDADYIRSLNLEDIE